MAPFRSVLLALAASLTATVFGQVIVNPSGFVDYSTYAVSNTDLLQTRLSSAVFSGGPLYDAEPFSQNLATLTDGTFGSDGYDATSSVGLNNGTLTFSFDLTASPAGYTLTGINSYAMWGDAGRSGQGYTVEYSLASAPTTFLALATVEPFNIDDDGEVRTLIEITGGSGTLATNVAALRFTFDDYQNGGTAYREIDAFGSPTAVPEPGVAALVMGVGAGTVAFLRRRRAPR